jgi:hypothetical protein
MEPAFGGDLGEMLDQGFDEIHEQLLPAFPEQGMQMENAELEAMVAEYAPPEMDTPVMEAPEIQGPELGE